VGRAPFESWFHERDARAQAKVTVALDRLKCGNVSNVAGVGESVFELKLDWGPGWRSDRHFASRRNQEASEPRYRDGQGLLARLQIAQAGAARMKEQAQCRSPAASTI
jgi:putative addiction module killer protein